MKTLTEKQIQLLRDTKNNAEFRRVFAMLEPEIPMKGITCAEDLPSSIKDMANEYSNKGEYHGCRQASYFGFLRGAMAMSQFTQRQVTERCKECGDLLDKCDCK